jgi:hypothetical protein
LDLHNQLLAIEKQLDTVKEKVVAEKKLLNRINNFRAVSLAQQDELFYLQSHLPAHLPGKIVIESQHTEPGKGNIPVISATDNMLDEHPKKTDPPKKITNGLQPPTISYVTVDELENTPKYMKGRLTLDKINIAIHELQKLMDGKYRILSLPVTKMNDKSLKKYKAYKDIETTETKGMFFVAEPDLVDTTHLKQGDATGKAIISVLRHLHRLKDLGGSPKRYVIVG